MRPPLSNSAILRTAALVLAGVLPGASRGEDWPRWRGSDGAGISKDTSWTPQSLSAAKVKWKANPGAGHSSVAVAAKRVYTMGNQGGAVYCRDSDGETACMDVRPMR